MNDWRRNLVEDDDGLRTILVATRTIAVIGMKQGPDAVSYRIPAFMHERGRAIVPVNPKLGRVLDVEAVATLNDIGEPIDMVNVFRAPGHVPAHAEETLAMSPLPSCFWMQLGIRAPEAAERLARAGIKVVQDRCLLVEYQRLAVP